MADAGNIANAESRRHAGLLLAGVGTAAIALGTISYYLTLQDLQQAGRFRGGRPCC
jgi:putative membrane protein